MKIGAIATALALSALLAGCVLYPGDERRLVGNSSSLMEFLYPTEREAPMASRPQLPVPLHVGLAFLPPKNGDALGALDAAHKEDLLQRIRQRFLSRKFIADITIIPDYYLAQHTGFDGLAGVQRLYNVDVMALVSYDQVAHEDANEWSLGYLTIVGTVVLKGNRHDVSTLVDLAVVDAGSRALVLRAGGTDNRHGNVTLIDEPLKLRAAAREGFDRATDAMIDNFDSGLAQLQTDIRDGKANVDIDTHTRHAGGGAASGWLEIMALWGLVLISRVAFRPRVA